MQHYQYNLTWSVGGVVVLSEWVSTVHSFGRCSQCVAVRSGGWRHPEVEG